MYSCKGLASKGRVREVGEMREIKFRAWDIAEKRMFQVNPVHWEEESACRAGDDYLANAKMVGWELMQYTGLKDKNGKEIYEGDIVRRKVKRDDWYPEQYMPKVQEHPKTKEWIEIQERVITMQPEIRYGHELICGKLRTAQDLVPNQAVSGWDYEVVGNIYA